MPFLETNEVMVRFGGVMALGGVDIAVPASQVTGLIGPNGAGKTTLFNVISGIQTPTSGTVTIDAMDVTRVAPHRRARLGLARTFQRLELFGSLSVRDNVRVAGELARVPDVRHWVDSVLTRVGLSDLADQTAGDLPTGSARLVEIARALATKPRLLLLDEPASGLDESETEHLGALLRSLAAEGLGILLVEHDVGLVMRVCDSIYVLDLGLIIAHGTPEEIKSDPQVLSAYLGAA